MVVAKKSTHFRGYNEHIQKGVVTIWCILQVKSAEKCNDFLHSLAAHFLFYLVI